MEEAKSDDFTVDPCQASEDSSGDPLHPPMHDSKAVSLAILMANAFSRPTANGIDDVGWTFNGAEAVPQTVPEGVDDTSIWHPWFQPFV